MTPAEFYDRCKTANWFYQMSSGEPYLRGREAIRDIKDDAEGLGPECVEIARQWADYSLSVMRPGDDLPKPSRPEVQG